MKRHPEPSVPGFDKATELPPIRGRYLLVTQIPTYLDDCQRRYTDPLWLKDLREHLVYLNDFTLACPRVGGKVPESAVPLDSDPRLSRVKFVDLPATRSLVHAVLLLPATLVTLWRAIRNADIVHTGVAGWPIPTGWLAIPLARILNRHSIVVVESAPWRLEPGLPTNLKSRIKATVYERLGRWCLKNADLGVFTQEEYRQSFLKGRSQHGYVIHASWIDEDVILSDRDADIIWKEKLLTNRTELRILFVGRLTAAKGISILLAALRLLAQKHEPVKLDILGAGELSEECAKAGEELQGATRVQLLGTVAYGPPLFQLLRQYHAVVIPNISDEQPRIVYDAYSQGVPVLATRTAGLRDCVCEQRTGWLVEPNDPRALSELIELALHHQAELRRMGMEAIQMARSLTHQRMHRQRHRLLLQYFNNP